MYGSGAVLSDAILAGLGHALFNLEAFSFRVGSSVIMSVLHFF